VSGQQKKAPRVSGALSFSLVRGLCRWLIRKGGIMGLEIHEVSSPMPGIKGNSQLLNFRLMPGDKFFGRGKRHLDTSSGAVL
jgi:hypothetical protein